MADTVSAMSATAGGQIDKRGKKEAREWVTEERQRLVCLTVDFGRKRVGRVDGNDLPVRLALVNQRKRTKHLDLHNGASGQRGRANLHHVHRIAIPDAARHAVLDGRVLVA